MRKYDSISLAILLKRWLHIMIVGIVSLPIIIHSEEYPIIFLHGVTGSAYSWDSEEYSTAMKKILKEGYHGYKAGEPLNCNENSSLSYVGDKKRIYNFLYYHPKSEDPKMWDRNAPGAIGSNGNLVPTDDWPEWQKEAYENNLNNGSWAQNLADFIDKVLTATGASKVSIVAHSMGGLVARSAIRYYGCANKVHKLLMIGTPNHSVETNFAAYVAIDLVSVWPLWLHRGEGIEMGIDRQLEEVGISTIPPFIHIVYGEEYNIIFRDVNTGETGTWIELLNKGDWAGSVEYSTISGNYNPYSFGLGYDDGVVDVSWVQLVGATFNPTIYAGHSNMESNIVRSSATGELSLLDATYTTEFIKNWIIDNNTSHNGAYRAEAPGAYPNPWAVRCLRIAPGINNYQNALTTQIVTYEVINAAPHFKESKAFPIYQYTNQTPGNPVYSNNSGNYSGGNKYRMDFYNYDMEGLISSVESFEMVPITHSPSSVFITSPSSGEVFAPGDNCTIRWESNDVAVSQKLYYSVNSGSWQLIATLNGTTRSYNWKIPSYLSGDCKLKIEFYLDVNTPISGIRSFYIIRRPKLYGETINTGGPGSRIYRVHLWWTFDPQPYAEVQGYQILAIGSDGSYFSSDIISPDITSYEIPHNYIEGTDISCWVVAYYVKYVGSGSIESNGYNAKVGDGTIFSCDFEKATIFSRPGGYAYENTFILNETYFDKSVREYESYIVEGKDPKTGVSPHSGDRMYKVKGYDQNGDSPYDGITFKLFDYHIPITNPTYLSFWMCIKKLPTGADGGNITLQGEIKDTRTGHTPEIYQWRRYGRIIDQHSRTTAPTYFVPPEFVDGKWHQYVYSLTPAAGETLISITVNYEGKPKDARGEFIAYIDDIQITHKFPIENCWYGEIFGNGGPNNENSDENFELRFDSTYYEIPYPERPQGPYTKIRVLPQNSEDCGGNVWVEPYPSIRYNIEPDIPIEPSTHVSWAEWDRRKALSLWFLIEEQNGTERWLVYSSNAGPDWWEKPGWVNMGTEECYDEWRTFTRQIWSDYEEEYGHEPKNAHIKEARLAHFWNSSWQSRDDDWRDWGGVVCPTGPPWGPGNEPTWFPIIVEIKNKITWVDWGIFCDPNDAEAWREEMEKNYKVFCFISDVLCDMGTPAVECWAYTDEKIISSTASVEFNIIDPPNSIEGASIFLSRNGGKSFPETLGVRVPMDDSVKVETLMVDGNKRIRVTAYKKFIDSIPYIPSKECKAMLVVYDKQGNSSATISEGWEIPIVSYTPKATAYNIRPIILDNKEIHLVYATLLNNKNRIFYLYTQNTKPWLDLKGVCTGKALSMDKDVAAGVDNSSSVIFYLLREADEWSEPIPLEYADENIGEHFSLPSVALRNDTVHIAYISVIPQSQAPPLHRLIYLKFYRDIPPDSVIEEVVNIWAGDGDYTCAPSLILDYKSRPLIGFRGGYAYKIDGGWEIEGLPDPSFPPSLASYGGNVYMLYSLGNTLIRRYGYSGDYWLGEDTVATLSNLQAFEISNGHAIIWQDGDDILLRFYDPISNSYSPLYNIGKGAFPHTLVYNDSINKAFSVFTQPDSEYYKVAYRFTEDPYNLAYYYIELGKEEPSPFTVYREGFADGMDIGDSLVYYVPKLDSSRVYRVLMELYSPSSETVMVCIDGDTSLVEISGQTEVERIIPQSLNDLWIEIRGDGIGCRRIIVYPEATTGYMVAMGGPQETRISPPKIFKLYQAYPNPTTRSTVIRFQIPVKTSVSLKVYDVTGRLVRTLTRAQSLEPGVYTVEWDGRSDRGLRVPSGVYFYRLVTEGYRATRKLVWVR